MKPVLALDLATRLGWALQTDGDVTHGQITLDHQTDGVVDPPKRLLSARRELRKLLRHVAWGGVVVRERPITRAKSAAAIEVAQRLAGQLDTLVAELDVELVEIDPATLKKWTTGNGRAEKDDMVAAVEERWGIKVASHDAADAVALLHWYRGEVE